MSPSSTGQDVVRFTPRGAFEHEVRVLLLAEGAEPARVGVAWTGVRTAELVLPRGADPDLPRGAAVVVRFESERIGGTFDAPAVVARHLGSAEEPRLRVAYREGINAEGRFLRKLQSLFNQRRAYRVRPPSGERVPVHFRPPGGGGWVRGELVDISVLGIAITLPAEAAERVSPGDRARVGLALPGAPTLITARVRVANLLPLGRTRARVGCELAVERLDHAARRAITDYVMRRQLEERRARGPATVPADEP